MQASTLGTLLLDRANERTDALAFAGLNGLLQPIDSLTYRTLDEQAAQLAGHLARNTEVGDRVVLLFPPGTSYIVAFFACIYARRIAIPASPSTRKNDLKRLSGIVRDSGASLILTNRSLRQSLGELESETAESKWLSVDDDLQFESASPLRMIGNSEDIAYLQYTSGTTSSPKGVVLSHANVLSNLAYIDNEFAHDESSVGVSWLPHFHDMGLVYGILQPLFNRFPCYLMTPLTLLQNPIRWLEAITQYRATHSGGPNFAYDHCVSRISGEKAPIHLDLTHWRVAFTGAEPVKPRTLAQFSECYASVGFRSDAFFPAYGLAEATLKVSCRTKCSTLRITAFDSTSLGRGRALPARHGLGSKLLASCGRWGLGTEVVVVSPDDQKLLPEGSIGEIWVSGPSVAVGYWSRESAPSFDQKSVYVDRRLFLRTGDLGFISDQELYVTGRLKDLVIVRGQNYYPQDIEQTAITVAHLSSEYSGALFQYEGSSEERTVLIQEAPSKPGTDWESLADQVYSAVTEEHGLQIDEIVFVRRGEIPRTSSGKIQRSSCSRLHKEGSLRVFYVRHRLPQSMQGVANPSDRSSPAGFGGTLHVTIRDLVARIGGISVDQVNTDRSLASHGLDSLRISEFHHACQREFGTAPPFSELMRNRSIKEVMSLLPVEKVETDPLSPLSEHRSTTRLLSKDQTRLLFLHRVRPTSSAHNLACAFEISGPLRRPALTNAIAATCRRHPLLNSIVMRRDNQFEFATLAGAGMPIFPSIVDSSMLDSRSRLRLACQVHHRPFLLFQESAVRVIVMIASPVAHLLIIVCHHLIADAQALQFLAEEIADGYSSNTVGPKESVAERPLISLGSALSSQPRSRVEQYWREHLADLPFLKLPLSSPRRRDIVWRAESIRGSLSTETAESISNASRYYGVTLHTIAFGAYFKALSEVTGQTDIVVALAVTTRFPGYREREIDNASSFLPIRLRLGELQDPNTLLAFLHDSVIDAKLHSMIPIEEMFALANVKREFGIPFGCQTLFRLVDLTPFTMPGLVVQPLPLDDIEIEFDVVFSVYRQDCRILTGLQYNAEIVSKETAEYLNDAFTRALEFLSNTMNYPATDLAPLV